MHLKLHGQVSLQQTGEPPASLERKQAGLLAYLDHEGPTPRALLAGLLWPGATNEGARSNLRQCIARLRRLAPGLLIDSTGLLSIASAAAVLPADPVGSTLLATFDYADCEEFGRWLQARREDDCIAQRNAFTAAIRDATQRGDFAHAQTLADALLGLDRESEESYRALMELAYLRGDFATALAVLGRCTRMLEQLYGVGPSAATRELGQTILAAARQGEGDLRRAMPALSASIPLSVLRPPRLIARSAQLGAILAAWRSGLVVCVCGEAGIGKSRLLAEFVAAVGSGITVAARPGDADRPYASLTRLVVAAIERFRPAAGAEQAGWIARLLPAVGPWLGAAADPPTAPLQTERERGLALMALRNLLMACRHRGCTAVVLDDLHFADRATIEALPSLILPAPTCKTDAAAVLSGPCFALGSRLDDADAPGTRLVEALATSRDVLRIDLVPLADAHIHELVESLMLPGYDVAELAGRLRAQVGGNPAFLLETLKLLLSLRPSPGDALPIPPGIEAVIQRRISLLGAPARHIAQIAAVAGHSYDLAMAAEALAYPIFALTEPLRELEERQILHGRRFVHDLVASAAKRSIPASVAEFMERFVAEYLAAREGDPAVVAGHWRACGDWRRAGDCNVRAAAANASAMRPREQAEHLDAAIECYDEAGADEPLFRAIATRLDIVEVADKAVVRSRLLERLAKLARTEEQALHVLLHRLAVRSDHAQADGLAGLQDGLRRARAVGDHHLEFNFVEAIAQLLSSHGRFQEAIDLLASIAPWAEAQADARLRGRLERTLAAAHAYCDHLALAIEHGDRAIAVFRSIGDDLNSLPTMSNVGIARLWRGELDAARSILERALQVRDRLHGGLAPNTLDINLACVLRDLGEFELADERFVAIAESMRQTLRDSADEPATDLALTENHHAQMWLMLGRADRALAVMRVDDSGVETRFRARRLALRLRAARLSGHDTRGLEAAAAALLPGIESAFHRSLFELETLRSAPAQEAAAGFERLHAEPAVIERPGLRLQAAMRAAAARLACGDTACAAGWIEAAKPAMAAMATIPPFDMTRDEPWLIARDVFAAIGDEIAAANAKQCADEIVTHQTARLPAAWFLT